MNFARWELAYHMIREREKQELIRWSTFFGTNLAALSGKNPEENPDGTISIIPLSTLINPEVMQKIEEQSRMENEVAEVVGTPDADYERMMKEMEDTGHITVIEDMFPDINKRRHKEDLRRARVELVPDE